MRAAVFAFFLASAIAASALAPVCNPNCAPDPTSSTYSSFILARAQIQHARGMADQAPHVVAAGIEHLPGSQSYSYAMPVLSLPGRNGLDVNLTLYYNSQLWTVNGTDITFNADRDWPSYGFRLGYGYLEKDSANNAYVLTEADGSKHRLNLTSTSNYDSADSSYIHLGTGTPANPVIYYKNGHSVVYEGWTNNSTVLFRPIEISDSNGNYITINYVSGKDQQINTITDTLGRVLTFNYTNDLLTTITQDTGTPDARTWTFNWYTQYPLNYSFSGLTVRDAPASGTITNILSGLVYPNSSSYFFGYTQWGIVDHIERYAGSYMLSRTGYDYPTPGTTLTDAPSYDYQFVYYNKGGTWTTDYWNYSVTKSSGIVTSSYIIDPFGTKTITNLNTSGSSAGLVANVHIQNASSQDLRVATYTWGFDGSGNNARVTAILTTLSDSGQQSKVEFGYDSAGNINDLKEYDYGLVLTRETVTNYLVDVNYPHLLNLPIEIKVKNGAGTVQSLTQFAYDGATLDSSHTGETHHYDTWWMGSHRGNLTTVTRYKNAAAPSGAIARNFTYDFFGNVITADLDCCNQKSWTYSSTYHFAYPDSITKDPTGTTPLTTSATYNVSRGTIATSTDENGEITSYGYDSSDRLRTVTLPNSVIVTTDYDDTSATPSITRYNSFNSAKSITTFDGQGRAFKDEAFDDTTLLSKADRTFDAVGRVLTVTNPYLPGNTIYTNTTAYDSLGRVSSIAPPSGGSTTYSYSGNKVLITDPAGKVRRNHTDALGRLVQVDEPGWHDAISATGSFSVTGSADRQTKVFDEGGLWHWEYDEGQIDVTVGSFSTNVTYDSSANATGLGSAIAAALNVSASPVTASASGGVVNFTAKTGGVASDLSISISSSTTSSYFTTGTTSFPASASGSTMTGGVDATSPSGPSIDTPLVTTYNYDATDNLTQSCQAALDMYQGGSVACQQRNYSYDSLGRVLTAATPESGTVTYTYKDFGAVETRTDARSIVTTYSYDTLHRLTGISYSDSTPSVTLGYDSGGSAANALGRLTSMSDGSGSETYSYNAMGMLSSRVKTISSTNYTTSYGYDDLGGLTTITYPSGRIVSQGYDDVGRLNQISSGGTNYLSSMAYDPSGQVHGFTYGNGLTASFGYNDHLQLSSLEYANGGTDRLKLNYGYGSNNNGQILTIDDMTTGSANAATSLTYTYDPWLRLKTAQTNNLTSANTWKLEWAYDRLGNRLSQTLTGGTATVTQPAVTIDEATNRISTTSGFVYDAAGNMTTDGGTSDTFTYDAENRLKSVNGSGTYVYDGNGLRIQKDSTTYIYSGTKVIAEYTSSGLDKEYIYSGSQLLATLDSSGNPTYSHPDHLSTRIETDTSGNTVRAFGHFPYGETWYETGTANKLKFTTYERDSSGLDYAMMRYHSMRLGRFLSADLLDGYMGNPQTLNRYSYVLNNPINFSDSFGLAPCEITVRFGGTLPDGVSKSDVTNQLNSIFGSDFSFVEGSKADFRISSKNDLSYLGEKIAGYAPPNSPAILLDGNVISSHWGELGQLVPGPNKALGLASIIAHEIGHKFGQSHQNNTMMQGGEKNMEGGWNPNADGGAGILPEYGPPVMPFTAQQLANIKAECDKYKKGPKTYHFGAGVYRPDDPDIWSFTTDFDCNGEGCYFTSDWSWQPASIHPRPYLPW